MSLSQAALSMPDFWLDSNSFITPSKGPYGFDILPRFWSFLEQKAREGIIASSLLVYRELQNHVEDELSRWAAKLKDSGFFVDPDPSVQAAFREIADYVKKSYPAHQASQWLDGADPWLVAHARVHGGRVVTFEKRVAASSSKPKIPNVGEKFGVKTLDLWDLLRELGWRVT